MTIRYQAQTLFALIVALLLLSGCAVGPDYVSPQVKQDLANWEQSLEAGFKTSEAELPQWWKNLDDTRLNQLVMLALENNLDLAQSRSRIREARAQRNIAAAAGIPSLSARATTQSQKSGDTPTGSLYSSGFDAAWELDVFGRVKRSIEASSADLDAKVESLRDVQVSLLSELALNFIDVRSFQNRLRLAEANVELQEKTYSMVKNRLDLGLATILDIREAESNLANNKAQIPQIKTGLSRAMHRIAVLVGQKPGKLNQSLAEPGVIPMAPPEIPIGIPADLLRRRPDIRMAERELAAQTARVGVAIAELYPRFTLSGALSFQATDSANLFTTLSRALSFGPSLQWNIFSGGSIRNNITVQNERQKQALLRYEKSILTALEEVENGMVAYARELDRRENMLTAAVASRESVRLAESMYKDGLTDFSRVLDAQRNLFTHEDQLADSDAEVTRNLIRLYKALGGGWKDSTESMDPEKKSN